jgi:hypothetical protein
MRSEAGPPQCNTLPTSLVTLESRSPWLLGRHWRQLRKSCAGANTMYSRAERVFILEHCLASKSSAAVREAFRNEYPDKEVPSKTTIHRLVTEFRNKGSVRDGKHVQRRTLLTGETLHNGEETLARSPQKSLWRLSDQSARRATKQLKLRPYRFQAVHQLQQRDTAERI